MRVVPVTAEEGAREFVQDSGGHVYVWADQSGMKHVATSPPDESIEFESLNADGFTLHQDVEIVSPPDRWHVVLRHFPHRHVDALWGNWTPSFGSPGIAGP